MHRGQIQFKGGGRGELGGNPTKTQNNSKTLLAVAQKIQTTEAGCGGCSRKT